MDVSDFSFVRALAAEQRSYTVPPPYVLWMLSRFHGDLCTVAEAAGEGPVAYLLGMSTTAPPQVVFVWQLASTIRGRSLNAPFRLVAHLRKIAAKLKVRTILYTATRGSVQEQLIRSLAERVFHRLPEPAFEVPQAVCRSEYTYSFLVRPLRRRRNN